MTTPAHFDTMDGKMLHYDAIWNAILELQRQVENKMERVILHYLERFVTSERKNQACILTLFETIWDFREFFKTQGGGGDDDDDDDDDDDEDDDDGDDDDGD